MSFLKVSFQVVIAFIFLTWLTSLQTQLNFLILWACLWIVAWTANNGAETRDTKIAAQANKIEELTVQLNSIAESLHDRVHSLENLHVGVSNHNRDGF